MQSNTHPSYHNHIKAFLPYIFFHCSYVVYAILHMNHLWNTPNNHLRIQKDICILFISNVIKEMENILLSFLCHSASSIRYSLDRKSDDNYTKCFYLYNISILAFCYMITTRFTNKMILLEKF